MSSPVLSPPSKLTALKTPAKALTPAASVVRFAQHREEFNVRGLSPLVKTVSEPSLLQNSDTTGALLMVHAVCGRNTLRLETQSDSGPDRLSSILEENDENQPLMKLERSVPESVTDDLNAVFCQNGPGLDFTPQRSLVKRTTSSQLELSFMPSSSDSDCFYSTPIRGSFSSISDEFITPIQNPFDSSIIEKYEKPTFSPSTFLVKSSGSKEPLSDHIRWSVGDICSAEIDEKPHQQIACPRYDEETEKKIQSAIDKFFASTCLPSPSSVQRSQPLERCKSAGFAAELEKMNKSLKCVDAQCQTLLTFPRDIDLVQLLGGCGMFLYDEDDDRDCVNNEDSNSSSSSLRRKLFGVNDGGTRDRPLSNHTSRSASGLLKYGFEHLNMCVDETEEMEESVHLVSSPVKGEGNEFSRRSTWCGTDTFDRADISPIRDVGANNEEEENEEEEEEEEEEEGEDETEVTTNISMDSFEKSDDQTSFSIEMSGRIDPSRFTGSETASADQLDRRDALGVAPPSDRGLLMQQNAALRLDALDADSEMVPFDGSASGVSHNYAFIAQGGTFSTLDSGISSMNFTDGSKFYEMSRLRDNATFSTSWKIPLKASTPHSTRVGNDFGLEN